MKTMLKNSVFKTFGHDCLYFDYVNDNDLSEWNTKTLRDTVNVKILIQDNKNASMLTIEMDENFLNGVNPSDGDIIYLNKRLYRVTNVTKVNESGYTAEIEKLEAKLK